MATQLSNKCKVELLKKNLDLLNDTIKIALVSSGFTFSQATHGTLADVSASLLTEQYGYTVTTLAGAAAAQDNVDNLGYVSFNNVSWNATGGAIGPSPGAIVYDDTHTDDVVLAYIDFGSDKTAAESGIFTISSIKIGIGPND
jgi:hypothetical protein